MGNEDLKAKMKEALEKKNAAKHNSAQGAGSAEKAHGPEVSGGGPKLFRRKSG